ncbi:MULTISPECIES: EVE domain-containing protein [unclassified Saccharibacter]|uniref:EVE domain-containing protein n=1 Tax=unclassified Saccharibacter TaxID=2648722 RepID=UPI001321C096|nr:MULTISPECIES: EVE domain-containing protein [unclassified Saccharibacter]MXV35233.1 EVE domain-containing protein [Saccharibacter sp. EH611]MXV57220.1 EVE domain-containing protein [Saccharibacter sp. EH70]MXV64919.1 EVE domain-containing protein [Saccharibacter sp. EH60]
MAYWLIKSEPASFSWEEQVRNDVEPWNGVRNYQARNNLSAMRCGDRALFYHSVTEKRIVGVVEVVKEAYPDPTTEDTRWVCVDVKADGAFKKPISLADIKADPNLTEMALLKQSRLSVAPVTEDEFAYLTRRGEWEQG